MRPQIEQTIRLYATSENIRADVSIFTKHSAEKEIETSRKERRDIQKKYVEYKQNGLGEGLEKNIGFHPSLMGNGEEHI